MEGWARGLTKETDNRVAHNSEALRKFWQNLNPEERARRVTLLNSVRPKRGQCSENKSQTLSKIMRAGKASQIGRIGAKRGWELHPEEQIKVMRSAMKLRPNKSEQKLLFLLDKYMPSEWKYVGNGEIVLGRRCPDFININGKKVVIELFGTYWHPIFDVAKRVEHYRQYGFNTIVIWQDELTNVERLVKRIKKEVGRFGK